MSRDNERLSLQKDKDGPHWHQWVGHLENIIMAVYAKPVNSPQSWWQDIRHLGISMSLSWLTAEQDNLLNLTST